MRLIKSGKLIYDEELMGMFHVFKDRVHAGKALGLACREVLDKVDYVLAVPMGGIPVGAMVSKELKAEFDVIICRKLLIPWNREAGFGAVDPDGNYFVDEAFARAIGLSNHDIKSAVEEQLAEIKKRNQILRRGRGYPSYKGLTLVLVDDGIAAGYTMKAAINFVLSRGAEKVIIAVPTGCLDSLLKLLNEVDIIICLNVRSGPWFAVADAYVEWSDLDYGAVIKFLNET
ncbi:MAG: phosphoribosyltransferase family protein [Candidatus Nezhaarchaeota archaeon]|nr:phosphoribosyltransferase family protein [Candidatus Nezhaarchaeota archaeon]MCX8141340.1 phosphoribosyltransferase family protein [Candidatus Nezhaarchaeota archaeon]MDW8049606.1 phosphoribosyltransferase family protein [Nitrososphaerota archaeon]